MNPIRVQRKRTAGFKLPENTVCVTRGTKWGNPFKVGEGKVKTAEEAIRLFELNLYANESLLIEVTNDLKGKNLACFCKIGDPCHADILLEIANS